MVWSQGCRALPLECRKDQECPVSKPFCLGAICKECLEDADCKGGQGCLKPGYACGAGGDGGKERPEEPQEVVGENPSSEVPEGSEALPEKECSSGQRRSCYGGDPATEGRGECKRGSQVCSSQGLWGPCEGEIRPAVDLCGDGKDNDCDGKTDETCCQVDPVPVAEIPLRDLQNKPPTINSLAAFSGNHALPFGQTTIVATSQFDMYIVDLDSQKQTKVVQVTDGGAGGVNAVVGFSAFHPDGKSLATGDYNGMLNLWETKTWTGIRIFPDPDLTAPDDKKAHKEKIHQVLFSPDGSALFSVASDTEIKEWRSDTGQLKGRLKAGHPGYSIALGEKSGRFFSGHLDGFALSWDLGNQRSTILTQTASTQFSHLAFDPQEKQLALAGSYPVLWDLERDIEIAGWLKNLPSAKPLRLAYHPAGKWLAIAFNTDALGIWDTTTGERSVWLDSISADSTRKNVWGLVWAKGGAYLIAGAYGRLQVWSCKE